MSDSSKLVKPDNTLKKKVGHGGFKDSDLVRAQSMIENNKIDFKPIAQDLIAELSQVLDDIKGANIKQDAFGSLMYPMMQLRAQGALFHYPIITTISDIVVDFIDGVGVLDAKVLEIVVAYKKSVTAILTLGIKDLSAKAGQQLCSELKAACERYKKANGA